MTHARPRSIFEVDPPEPGSERFETLYQTGAVVIERIVSSGTQPSGQYCQPQDEWILLLRGSAEIRLDGCDLSLREGDTLALPANVPHEVLHTSANALWLAVHIHPPPQSDRRAGE